MPRPLPCANAPWNGWKMASSSDSGMPDALVLHDEHARGVAGFAPRAEAQPAAVGHRPQAVGRQVPDDLPHLALRRPRTRPAASGTSTSTTWSCPHLGAVAQQQGRVLQHRPQVQPRDAEPLGPRVGQEAADRLVQPLRLAQHDVHQLRLLAVERQFLAQDLDRSRHRRQRVADLVGDARRHLADGRQPLLQARVALEPPDRRHVLEGEQEARRARRDVSSVVALRPRSISAPSARRYR